MELLYLFSAHTLKMLDICIRFCESISKGFSVTDWNSRIDARVVAIYKGHYYLTTKMELWYLFPAHHLIMLCISTKFQENI